MDLKISYEFSQSGKRLQDISLVWILEHTVTLVSLCTFCQPEKQTKQFQTKRKYNVKDKKSSQL